MDQEIILPVLIKWSQFAMPKQLGGWGVKNIHWFTKELAAKSLWGLTQNSMLWGKEMATKYFPGRSLVD
jgi:hypothetical protein